MNKDPVKCLYCGKIYDYAHETSPVYFCERCGEFFCAGCFQKLAGKEAWAKNFEQPILLCPKCWKVGKKLKYFEVALSKMDADDCNAVWICIRGVDTPTIEDANRFMARDVEKAGMPVVGVFPIDKEYAMSCYDFSNEDVWPIFSRGGAAHE